MKTNLLSENLRLQAEVRSLIDPPMTDEQVDQAIASVTSFFSTMNSAQGAVAAANLYDRAYFSKIYNGNFRRKLLAYLLEAFKNDSLLIEGTYNYWLALNEANA